MTRRKTKKLKFLKGEKLMYFLLVFLIVAIPIWNVFTQALLSKSNIEVERLKKKIASQGKINESLNMQINELASLDNVKSVADEYGLSYNNDNIKNIGQ